MREIPQTIHITIDILRKTFGGTTVELISNELIHIDASEHYPNGRWGVNIEVMGIPSFLGLESNAEDIAYNPYGHLVAEEFVHRIVKETYPDLFKRS